MKKNLLYLAGLLIVLVVVFLLFQASEKKQLSVENIDKFFWADTNLLDSMAIRYGSWTELFKRDGRWYMVLDSALAYPASTNDVMQAIQTTNDMVLTDLISVNPSKRAKFNVDADNATVIKFFGGGAVLSHFLLGQIGRDFTHTYVRREGSDSVFLAKGRFNNIYTKAPPQWMDRQIFNYAPGELAEIRWQHPDEETRIVPAGPGKFLISRDPDFNPVPADSVEAEYKYNYISQLGFSSFLPTERNEEASFDEITLVLTVTDTAGVEQSLIFAADTTAANRYHAIRPGQPRPVGLFYGSWFDRLSARYDEMLAADTSGS